jgi:hypothetical protein
LLEKLLYHKIADELLISAGLSQKITENMNFELVGRVFFLQLKNIITLNQQMQQSK